MRKGSGIALTGSAKVWLGHVHPRMTSDPSVLVPFGTHGLVICPGSKGLE